MSRLRQDGDSVHPVQDEIGYEIVRRAVTLYDEQNDGV